MESNIQYLVTVDHCAVVGEIMYYVALIATEKLTHTSGNSCTHLHRVILSPELSCSWHSRLIACARISKDKTLLTDLLTAHHSAHSWQGSPGSHQYQSCCWRCQSCGPGGWGGTRHNIVISAWWGLVLWLGITLTKACYQLAQIRPGCVYCGWNE